MSVAVEDREKIYRLAKRCLFSKATIEASIADASEDNIRFLTDVFQAESDSRDANRKLRLLKSSGLRQQKDFESYDWSRVTLPQGITQDDLKNLKFTDAKEDLILIGDVGCGKTHLAQALVRASCLSGKQARFFTAPELVNRLRRASEDHKLDKEIEALLRSDFIVIDELGYVPLDIQGARMLFQLIAEFYEKKSLVITTNLEFSRWISIFNDEQMAAAIVDRICHHGRILKFKGQSYRLANSIMNTDSSAAHLSIDYA